MASKENNVFKVSVFIALLISFLIMGFLFMKNQDQKLKINKDEKALNQYEKKVSQLKEDKSKLARSVDSKSVEIEELKVEISNKERNIIVLDNEKAELENEKNQLNSKIEEIRQKMVDIKGQDIDGKIKTINEQFKIIQEEKRQLLDRITSRDSIINSYKSDLASFYKVRKRLRQDSVALSYTIDSLYRAADNKDSLHVRYKREVAFIKEIVENTQIKIHEVTLSEKEDGKRLKRLNNDKRRRKWKYSTISFSIEHENMDLIEHEKFGIRLYDRDNKISIELYEKNKIETESKGDMIPFEAINNPITISHYNHDKKGSDNYEFQIFLLTKENKHMLFEGKVWVIKNGEIFNY